MPERHRGPDVPPAVARLLLRLAVGRRLDDEIAGGLADLFRQRLSRDGVRAARWWYRRQVVGFGLRGVALRLRGGGASERTYGDRLRFFDRAVRGARMAVRATRSLIRQPGFAALSVLTLALGIGANTAIFSVLNGVVLRPLPYEDPESLVVVWPEQVTNVRMTEWLAANTSALAGVSGVTGYEFALADDGGESARVAGARVSPNHFEVMGARPLVGRAFRPEDAEPGRSRVVVLAHALWQTRFGGDPGVIGRMIRIDFVPHLVIGVMPADYRSLEPQFRLWLPQEVEPGTTVGTDETWWVRTRVGRLAGGASVAAAQAELRVAAVRLASAYPAEVDRGAAGRATVAPLREALVGEFGRTLWILLGAVSLVLLTACSNVANLLLARSGARQREVAVRTAIGASRGQVIAQLLTESLVLGVLGGAAGIVLAWLVLAVLKAGAPADLPRIQEVAVDSTVLLFGLAVSLLTAAVFGLVPALRASRLPVRAVLAGGGRGFTGPGPGRLGRTLIAAEVAVAVVLIVAAGLMARTVWNLRTVDPGFYTDRVLTLHIAAPPALEDSSARTDLDAYRRVWEAVAALPGVEAVGGIHLLPLAAGNNRYPYWAENNEPRPGSLPPVANIRVATPGYLGAMGIPILEGRWFATTDLRDGPPVLVVNRSLADRLWPGASPVGKRIRLLDEGSFDWEVIGVIGDVHQSTLRLEPQHEIYLPHEQWQWPAMFATVRTAGDAAAFAPAVRRAIHEVDPDIAISRVATMEQVVAASIATNRFLAALTVGFALLALALGSVGVYGVLSYGVSRRMPEFGVRLALGSTRQRIIRQALWDSLRPVSAGLAIGVAAAWATTRLLSALLFDVSPTDPATFVTVVAVLLIVAAAASYLPARRAASADPTTAIRAEC